jgi:hypothetical protein
MIDRLNGDTDVIQRSKGEGSTGLCMAAADPHSGKNDGVAPFRLLAKLM